MSDARGANRQTSTFDTLWPAILDIGRNPANGGYRRFAWSDADFTLREWFVGEAERRGLDVEVDRNGNLWAWWMPPGWSGDPRDAFVTGSHLDSVPDGGAFDGPLGVVSAFAAIDIVRERGVVPAIPVGVAAFSDEEGARFGVACVGSQLSTGALTADRARGLRDIDGITLAEALVRAARDPNQLGPDRHLAERVGVFVELHVEQGRALDLIDAPVAVASSIWPHGRWEFTFDGEANHAGATRLVDRRDPMLAFASSVHTARAQAQAHQAVATFGKVLVSPNGANAIPSQIRAWLDARAADEATLTALVEAISAEAHGHATLDSVGLQVVAESITPIVEFPEGPRARLTKALGRLGEIPVLPTAAGHDAGILSAQVPTAMLFVRNPTGVSHSPAEHAEMDDCNEGAEALADVMADWISS
ncbi:allantoate amidohydrolase [Mycolicibacterium fluoranthenivorans]|uniref:N-carbamoyl-L-amino-acid hydrolase n=1 Tax=Mycolicibacterium fluoranthenivorans TaxID=258505 RepID=A0A7X5ZF86_9MYCO|nr:allantoate amidohydrolase [Mycolicibacterium fluoranthenivorans]MCV7356152.1 allantoate amidohydrolase [Mycolicibacterium fluoranthenivorans]NIH97930.1 N-carbamoyl-L-amino-acid hydrolase [Mycolicibacterium fluoranthenivorans]